MQKATQALFRLGLDLQDVEKKKDFTFVIDDFTDYHSLNDFKCPEARQLYTDWQSQKETLEKMGMDLEEKRQRYTRLSGEERKRISEELISSEQEYEMLETKVQNMPKEIRNLEINYIRK